MDTSGLDKKKQKNIKKDLTSVCIYSYIIV